MMNKKFKGLKKVTVALAIAASMMGTVAPVVAHADLYDFEDEYFYDTPGCPDRFGKVGVDSDLKGWEFIENENEKENERHPGMIENEDGFFGDDDLVDVSDWEVMDKKDAPDFGWEVMDKKDAPDFSWEVMEEEDFRDYEADQKFFFVDDEHGRRPMTIEELKRYVYGDYDEDVEDDGETPGNPDIDM